MDARGIRIKKNCGYKNLRIRVDGALILDAIAFVIIFVSTLTREIGRQFLKVNDLSHSFQLV